MKQCEVGCRWTAGGKKKACVDLTSMDASGHPSSRRLRCCSPFSKEKEEEQEEERSGAASQHLAEVTESRKPIKKMINIHVGDAAAAASMCRWDGSAIVSARAHSHAHTHI